MLSYARSAREPSSISGFSDLLTSALVNHWRRSPELNSRNAGTPELRILSSHLYISVPNALSPETPKIYGIGLVWPDVVSRYTNQRKLDSATTRSRSSVKPWK